MPSVSYMGRSIIDPHSHIIPLKRIPDALIDVPCILGIDEAGRGPVLGPMVYSLFITPIDKHYSLRHDFNVADSKELNPESRMLFASSMLSSQSNQFGWLLSIIGPDTISEGMLRRQKYNLNEMSYDTVFDLLRKTTSHLKRIEHVYVDALGKAEKYQSRLSNLFPNIQFTVKNKADMLYPVVGAASVMAKVTRDYELAMWPHRNPSVLLKGPLGTGYPSDPLTIAWLNTNVDKVYSFHRSLVRYSWSSTMKVLSKHNAKNFWKFESTVQPIDKENDNDDHAVPKRRVGTRRQRPLRNGSKTNP